MNRRQFLKTLAASGAALAIPGALAAAEPPISLAAADQDNFWRYRYGEWTQAPLPKTEGARLFFDTNGRLIARFSSGESVVLAIQP